MITAFILLAGITAPTTAAPRAPFEKRGLCVSLTASLCELPLHEQLGVFNSALSFAAANGFRFVGSTPESEDRARCPLLTSLFATEHSALRHSPEHHSLKGVLPVFRSSCDRRFFVPPVEACGPVLGGDSNDEKDDDGAWVSHARRPSRLNRWRAERDNSQDHEEEDEDQQQQQQQQQQWQLRRRRSPWWCFTPEYVNRGESERRCLAHHHAVAQMNVAQLTVKGLLGPTFRSPSSGGGGDSCLAVVELDARAVVPQYDFSKTRRALVGAFRGDIARKVGRDVFLREAYPPLSPPPPPPKQLGESELDLSSSLKSRTLPPVWHFRPRPGDGGRIRVVVHQLIGNNNNNNRNNNNRNNNAVLAAMPDAFAGSVAFPALALQGLLRVFSPDCLQIHIIPTAAGVVGDTGSGGGGSGDGSLGGVPAVFRRAPIAPEDPRERLDKVTPRPALSSMAQKRKRQQIEKEKAAKARAKKTTTSSQKADYENIAHRVIDFRGATATVHDRGSGSSSAGDGKSSTGSAKKASSETKDSKKTETTSGGRGAKESKKSKKGKKGGKKKGGGNRGMNEDEEKLEGHKKKGKKKKKRKKNTTDDDDEIDDDEEVQKAMGARKRRRRRKLLWSESSSSAPFYTSSSSKKQARADSEALEKDRAMIRKRLPLSSRLLMREFPELDFFVHHGGGNSVAASPSSSSSSSSLPPLPLLSPVSAFCAFASADVLLAAGGGSSRVAALLLGPSGKGVAVAPAARGFPLNAATVYGRRRSTSGSGIGEDLSTATTTAVTRTPQRPSQPLWASSLFSLSEPESSSPSTSSALSTPADPRNPLPGVLQVHAPVLFQRFGSGAGRAEDNTAAKGKQRSGAGANEEDEEEEATTLRDVVRRSSVASEVGEWLHRAVVERAEALRSSSDFGRGGAGGAGIGAGNTRVRVAAAAAVRTQCLRRALVEHDRKREESGGRAGGAGIAGSGAWCNEKQWWNCEEEAA